MNIPWSDISGWGAFGTLALLLVTGVLRENIVPGRAYRRVVDREALKDATIKNQAEALAELKLTTQATYKLLTVLPPIVEAGPAQVPPESGGGS